MMKHEITVPETAEMESTGKAIVAVAHAMVVQDQESHGQALEFLKSTAAKRKVVEEAFAEPKSAAWKAHRSIVELEQTLLQPCDDARRIVADKASRYEAECRRREEEERRRLEAEARKAEEDRILAEAEIAEAFGQDAVAEEILNQPVEPTPVVVPTERAKVEGVSSRELWRAEIVDLAALVRAAANNPAFVALLMPNMPALNALARATKQLMNVPGVKAVAEKSLAVRTK